MKSILIAFAMSLACMSTTWAQLQVKPIAAKIEIDGNNSDWEGIELSADEKTGLSYAAAYDDGHLYLMIVTSAMPYQLKVMNNGMNITLENKTGKKKTKGSIDYPYSKDGEPTMPQMATQPGQKPDMDYMRELYLLRNQRMDVKGFASKYSKSLGKMENENMLLAVQWNEKQEMIYELKVAVTELGLEKGSEVDGIEMNITVNGMAGAPMMGMVSGPSAMAQSGRGGASGRAGGARPTGAPAGAQAGQRPGGGVDMMNKATFKTTLSTVGN
jgi:hypothetical protein